MPELSPQALFILQYVIAGLASFFAQLCVSENRSLRQQIGETGKYCLIGGTCAPIFSALPILPAVVTKGEKLLFWAAACGGGLVTLPMLSEYMGKLIRNGKPNPQAGDSDK